ncbi:phosphoadenosine phosphosulfate reductase family protein [Candidatus Roizmanbacteria bacterium]|nr:phosphoadenosine phosphosulfate reductase family protein [Candidatus Roizmanbacteria bacterium]
MNDLSNNVRKSMNIIHKTIKLFPSQKTVVAWTGGKDSTVLLHLIRTSFNNRVPFPVMFNDSTMEFEEIYSFIKKIARDWDLKLVVFPHRKRDLDIFYKVQSQKKRKELSRIMKINSINDFVKRHKIKAFMAGIRWDEHPTRSQEKYFSPRENHTRIHPVLHFREKDIWDYIKVFNVPYVSLYDKGYRSLGEKPFTQKAILGKGERSGRESDKEQLMERLRNMGYW